MIDRLPTAWKAVGEALRNERKSATREVISVLDCSFAIVVVVDLSLLLIFVRGRL